MVRARVLILAAGLLAAGLAPSRTVALVPPGRWIAGDIDLHSTYSADVCPTPPLPSTCDPMKNHTPRDAGMTAIELVREAQRRGLEFVAITDRDVPQNAASASAQNDPEVAEYKRCHADPDPAVSSQCPVLVLDGTEKTLVDSKGFSSGSVSAIRYTDVENQNGMSKLWFPADPTPVSGAERWSSKDLADAVKALRDAGAMVFADRPASPPFGTTNDPYADRLTDGSNPIKLDGWDVWNGSYLDQSEFSGATAANNPQADRSWMTAVTKVAAAGGRLPVVGGSDMHAIASSATQGPGEPTLWVYDTFDYDAEDPTKPPTWLGIKDAIARGRTMVSALPPLDHGIKLYLETTDGAYMTGDVLPASNPLPKLQVRYDNAPAGAKIRVVYLNDAGQAKPLAGITLVVREPSDTRLVGQIVGGPGNPRWYRAEMYLEDALEPTLTPAGTVPGRSTAPCMPVWISNDRCFIDRYAMLAVTGPVYVPAL